MDYEATGGITIGGCAAFKITKRYQTKFAVGSKVYVRKKAVSKGKLEQVIIKKINQVWPLCPTCPGTLKEVNYVDDTNRVWLEHELVWQGEAIELAKLYWESIKEFAASSLNTCSPAPLDSCQNYKIPSPRPKRSCSR